MKKKSGIILIIIIAILILSFGLSCVLGRKPFKKLDVESIESATIHLIPPDVTVEIEDINRFAELLQDIVIYNVDPFPLFRFGQGVTYTVVFKDGTETKIGVSNPIIIIDGVRYKCEYEPCEALSLFGNSLIED